MAKSIKAVILLELIEVLERKGQYIEYRLVIIVVDNRYIHRRIIANIKKSNHLTQEAGAEIA